MGKQVTETEDIFNPVKQIELFQIDKYARTIKRSLFAGFQYFAVSSRVESQAVAVQIVMKRVKLSGSKNKTDKFTM